MNREEWKETTLGEVATFAIGRTPARKNPDYWTRDLTYPFLTIKGMGSGEFEEGVTDLAISGKKAKAAPEGALLLSFKLSVGRVITAPRTVYYNEAIAWLKPNEGVISQDFLALALENVDWTYQGNLAIKGKTLNSQSLKLVEIPLPPIEDQREIVSFMQALDQMIQAGDREISRAEQMRVDVLKTVLTDRANEWDYTPLREVATWRSGATPKAGNPEFYHGGTIKWAKIGDVQNAPIYDTETKITEAGFEKIKKIAPVGATLIAMYGASIGRSAFVMSEMATNQAILCGIPDEEVIVPEFLFLSALNLEDEFHRQGRGAAQPNINKTIIGDQEIPLPPLEEQEKIVEKMQALDAYLESAKRSQEALKQVRKDALHALLSGDKDVRELAEMFAIDGDVA